MEPLASSAESEVSRLTRLMARGDEQAYREFHADWGSRLFRYAVTLSRGDESTARDVLQETFIRVVRHVRRFECERVFWDWLALLCRSAAADHGRKQSRYRRFLKWFAHEPKPAASAPALECEKKLALRQAILALSEEDQRLVRAKYEEARSVRDIAAQEGCSEEALASRLARIRSKLRQSVKRHRPQ